MSAPRRALLLAALGVAGCAVATRPPSSVAQTTASQGGYYVTEPQAAPSSTPSQQQWAQPPSANVDRDAAPARATVPGAMTEPLRPPATMPPSPPPSPEPSAPRPAPVAGGMPARETQESTDAQISRYEAQIAAARAMIAADPATCRDVCGATSTICRAAGELCRLTGDRPDAMARDPRCRRAREVCADASRQRDGACPLCPTPR